MHHFHDRRDREPEGAVGHFAIHFYIFEFDGGGIAGGIEDGARHQRENVGTLTGSQGSLSHD